MGKLKGPEAIPGSLAFLSEGNYLVPLDFWYRSLWNLDTGAIVDQQKLKRKYNRAFVVAPHEMVIAAAQSDGHIAVAELLTSRPICLLVGPNATVRQVVFGSHGKLIASLDQEDNTVRLWSWLVSSADAKKRSLHALWKDLKSDDLKVAYEAVAELTARGPAAVEFLKGRLKPVTADNEYAAAVKQLDAAESGTRNKAHERLKHAGRDAETWLREGLNKEISVEAKSLSPMRTVTACGRSARCKCWSTLGPPKLPKCSEHWARVRLRPMRPRRQELLLSAFTQLSRADLMIDATRAEPKIVLGA
jgi:hypothetical protein